VKGLILAGGHGTRLRPLTFSGNKHMIPIANQPILFYGLRHLAQAGIRDVAIILGPIEEGIRTGVGDGSRFGLNVEYIVQGDPKGLAHAVICARDFLGSDPFLMYLGDNLLQSGVTQFVERFHVDRPDAVVGATPVERPQGYGVVEVDGDRIVSLEEKPAHPRSNLALIGVYLFTEAIHPIVANLSPSRRGELEITDAIWRLSRPPGRVSVIPVNGWWKDTGHPGDLLEANELVLRTMPPESFRVEGTVRPGADIDGPVGIGPGSVIEANAKVVGPAVLGSDVRVTSGSRVGPFCAIGNRVVVDRSTIQRSIVMDGTRIDGVSVVDSLVGRNVEVKSARPMARELTLTIGDSARIVF
jgi:glucose-1-phosphate thymidylyltransferase